MYPGKDTHVRQDNYGQIIGGLVVTQIYGTAGPDPLVLRDLVVVLRILCILVLLSIRGLSNKYRGQCTYK